MGPSGVGPARSEPAEPASAGRPRRPARARLGAPAAALVLAAAAGVAVPLATGGAGPAGGWTIVSAPATPDGGSDLVLATTCANSQECWAVGGDLGDINAPTQTVHPLVEEWNGSAWTLLPAPASGDGGLFGVTCAGGADCWAVGTALDGSGHPVGPLVEHWDGGSWGPVAAPDAPGASGAYLQGVSCSSSTDCWAVGHTTDSNGGALGSLVLHWDGAQWSVGAPAQTGQQYEQLNSVDCLSPADCWAVGTAGPQQQSVNFLPVIPGAVGDQGLVEHYDGAHWTVVPSYSGTPPDGSWLSAVTCVAPDDCWAAGSTTDSSGGPSGNLAERWDGTSWSVVAAPQTPGVPGILTGVTCLGPLQCWASGMVGPLGAGGGNLQPTPEVEAWNGTAWSAQPTPDVTALAVVTGITCVRADGCWTVGSAVTSMAGGSAQFQPLVEQLVLPPSSNQGLVAAAADGGIFTFGSAAFFGSMGGHPLDRPVTGVATTPSGDGYWEVASDGGMFAFGGAGFFGSMGGRPLDRPVVGMAASPDGRGYWEVASDGGVFAFGSARFYGSMGGVPLREPVVGLAASPDGRGYWEVASDGGVFAFGSARFYGSMGGVPLREPVVGLAATPNGNGYWEVASDGGVFTFGNAPFEGSVPGQGIGGPVSAAGMAATPDGRGYWIVGSDGSLYTYGDAAFLGSLAGVPLAGPVVGVAG